MRAEEVPQEQNKTLAGNKKAVYATNKEGEYNTVASEGWEVEEIVTSQAVEEFERLAQEALKRTHSKEASVLEYHMYKNRMDLALLSQTTGFFKWTIKRDFSVEKFKNISQTRAETYADVLGITLTELKTIPNL
jgi:hypothetical protein